jgi:hypothetical protein
MAFQNLRNNHQIYILHKDATPTLELGKVTHVSVPVPKYGTNSMYNDLVLDIAVEVDGKTTNFQKLPANSEIADFGNNIVIAISKEAMNSEVTSMKQRSLDILNSIEQHQGIINGCDEILKVLNPEIAEKQRQEQENKALREEINSLKEMFSEFMNQLKTK